MAFSTLRSSQRFQPSDPPNFLTGSPNLINRNFKIIGRLKFLLSSHLPRAQPSWTPYLENTKCEIKYNLPTVPWHQFVLLLNIDSDSRAVWKNCSSLDKTVVNEALSILTNHIRDIFSFFHNQASLDILKNSWSYWVFCSDPQPNYSIGFDPFSRDDSYLQKKLNF